MIWLLSSVYQSFFLPDLPNYQLRVYWIYCFSIVYKILISVSLSLITSPSNDALQPKVFHHRSSVVTITYHTFHLLFFLQTFFCSQIARLLEAASSSIPLPFISCWHRNFERPLVKTAEKMQFHVSVYTAVYLTAQLMRQKSVLYCSPETLW